MFTTFAPRATHAVNVLLFPARTPDQGRPIVIGNLGFWLVVGLVVWLLFLARFLLLAAAVVVIVAAQLAVWLAQAIAWPFMGILRKLEGGAARRWSARRGEL